MIDKAILDTLTIEGRNTLKELSGYVVQDNFSNNMPPNQISNFIMNSNLENGTVIK